MKMDKLGMTRVDQANCKQRIRLIIMKAAFKTKITQVYNLSSRLVVFRVDDADDNEEIK